MKQSTGILPWLNNKEIQMEQVIQEAKDFDSVADKVLDDFGKDTQSDSSSVIKPEDDKTKTPDSGAEPVKTEQVKAIEVDTSLSVEEKIAKIKEILGDDQKAIDAYVKIKGFHNDPAWQKQRELIDKFKKESETRTFLLEEDKKAFEEFKTFSSSPEYIQMTMKQQGYTQDAIDKKLQESGHEVKTKPQDDVNLVLDKLGIDVNKMSPETKENVLANVEDIIKIADILIQDRFSKTLPKELAPIQDHLVNLAKSDNATKLMTTIKDTLKTEGILDFDKDVEPELNKFLDENPDATQQDVFEQFKSINHSLTIARLKIGNKQDERDGKKNILRQNIPIARSLSGSSKRTGHFDKDVDAFFDTVNYSE